MLSKEGIYIILNRNRIRLYATILTRQPFSSILYVYHVNKFFRVQANVVALHDRNDDVRKMTMEREKSERKKIRNRAHEGIRNVMNIQVIMWKKSSLGDEKKKTPGYMIVHRILLFFSLTGPGGAIGPRSACLVARKARTRFINNLSTLCDVFADVSRNSHPN